MKRITVFLSIVITAVIFPALIFGQTLDSLKEKADSLYRNYEEEKALDVYKDILDKEPQNYQALWRSSFLYSRIGNQFKDEDRQEEYFNKGIDLAKRALAVDSTDTQSNFVMSVAMGRKALISGARDRVSASRDIKKYVDRAIKYDSTNAGAWHVLGRWNFKVANLSWLERAAANTLFGGIPGDASNEKAVDAIKKAIELEGQYIRYYYDLAKVYEEMGQEAQAIKTCQKAINLPVLTADDTNLKKKCQQLVQDI